MEILPLKSKKISELKRELKILSSRKYFYSDLLWILLEILKS